VATKRQNVYIETLYLSICRFTDIMRHFGLILKVNQTLFPNRHNQRNNYFLHLIFGDAA